MKKAKTIKKLIPFLSAILSVVFAFVIQYTYAANLIELKYGTKPNSTEAYLANQQYVVLNNTDLSPVFYRVGSHAVNVTMQYAIGYDFDLRIKYQLVWLDSDGTETELSTSNVELLFANRDNVIVDDEYIYYINYDDSSNPIGLPSGSRTLSLIAGVEIVDNATENYNFCSLKIKILEEKIHKAGVDYNDEHSFYKNVSDKESAKAWLAHKQSRLKNEDDFRWTW